MLLLLVLVCCCFTSYGCVLSNDHSNLMNSTFSDDYCVFPSPITIVGVPLLMVPRVTLNEVSPVVVWSYKTVTPLVVGEDGPSRGLSLNIDVLGDDVLCRKQLGKVLSSTLERIGGFSTI